jgi:hypothetical protein
MITVLPQAQNNWSSDHGMKCRNHELK